MILGLGSRYALCCMGVTAALACGEPTEPQRDRPASLRVTTATTPDGSELYVANEASGLDVVNVVSGAVTSYGFGTAGYGLGLTPDGAQLYVLLPDAGEVRVLERATRLPVKTILVGGRPRNVAFAVNGRTALVANEQAVVFIK
jgi:YVTN family beta-propeller protein